MNFIGFAIPIVLIALAAGFWVLVRASKEDNGLKDIGKVIGWIIVVISFIILIVAVYSSFTSFTYYSDCSMQNMKMHGRMNMQKNIPSKQADEMMNKMMPKESQSQKTK